MYSASVAFLRVRKINIEIKIKNKKNKNFCRVITGCLSSTPISLLHVQALLPPLRVTLTHQSLSFFERALRLPSTLPRASLANSNPRTRLKKAICSGYVWKTECFEQGATG